LRELALSLGQPNYDILVGDLGLSEDEYRMLIDDKVIGQEPPT